MKNTDLKDNGFRIKVINKQSSEDGADVIEEEALGAYREDKGRYYIKYRADGYLNMIKVYKNTVTVRRIGEMKSDMRYIAGETTEFSYITPYGSIQMSVSTNELGYELDSSGGEIKLDYILDTGGDKYRNNMKIIIER